MIYNFNLGIGWASSGVEYAQAYRAAMFRRIGKEARFVFTDMFPRDNIEHMTRNIGFSDSEIIWLYTYFTDQRIEKVSYTLEELKRALGGEEADFVRDGVRGTMRFPEKDQFATVYFTDGTSELVHRVELVSHGLLVRKDYFTSCRVYSEYYAPKENRAYLYLRRFFNRDGTAAYDEIIDGDRQIYRMPDRLLNSKQELVGYMVQCMHMTDRDTAIIDRTTGVGQAILMNCGQARVGIVIHADHFSENNSNDTDILWNNYYEYSFNMHRHISFYITATEEQNRLVRKQFLQVYGIEPNVVTIPVGSLKKLKYPTSGRKRFSMITASRLASEKHVDWIIQAAVLARQQVPDLTLDIYGQGGEGQALRKLIEEKKAEKYIRLCGQQDLTEVYQNYEMYISGSTSEGFGLTLMEAVGAGLPLIGFNVRYGNPTFIDEGRNGYLIPVYEDMDGRERVRELADRIIRLFTQADLKAFHAHSYEIASCYLTEAVAQRWAEVLNI